MSNVWSLLCSIRIRLYNRIGSISDSLFNNVGEKADKIPHTTCIYTLFLKNHPVKIQKFIQKTDKKRGLEAFYSSFLNTNGKGMPKLLEKDE